MSTLGVSTLTSEIFIVIVGNYLKRRTLDSYESYLEYSNLVSLNDG